MYSIERYEPTRKAAWDEAVKRSKNGTFLFYRDFMDYHSDRFADFSLMVYAGASVIALLAAHTEGNLVVSHGGLTYGGLLYGAGLRMSEIVGVFSELLKYLKKNGIATLRLKMIPRIYHKHPSDEQDYLLFLCNAKLMRRDALSVIDNRNPVPFTKDRRQCIRRGQISMLEVREEPAFHEFWEQLLVPNLQSKHGIMPVHTAAEMALLHSRFPENIRHFNVYHRGKIVAGTTVFVTDTVAHPQYISGQQDKNRLGSLDFLYSRLITNVFADKAYFDFGISNEEQGRKVNQGLMFWKESFGARTVTQDFYEVDTASYHLLENVLI